MTNLGSTFQDSQVVDIYLWSEGSMFGSLFVLSRPSSSTKSITIGCVKTAKILF